MVRFDCALANNDDGLNTRPPLGSLNHDDGEVLPADLCGSSQVLREGDLATIQETQNMGKGQLHSPLTSPWVALFPSRLFG